MAFPNMTVGLNARSTARLSESLRIVFCAWSASAALLLAGCGSAQVASVPQRVALDARPNSIAIAQTDNRIYITDDKTNSVLTSKDGKTFVLFATIPPVAGQPNALSQVTIATDGTLLIERFGFGTSGAVIQVGADKSVSMFSGVDPARRRLGLAVIGPGKLLSTWFVKEGNAPATGGISLITYDETTHAASEHNVLSGLAKPVGVAVLGDVVSISDQANNMILRTSLAGLLDHSRAGGLKTQVVKINGPDLLAIDKTGTLYTKCNVTAVCRISSDNTVTELANDFDDARGVAIDSNHHSLYVVDRAKGASGVSSLRIVPLNQAVAPD
ncbi:hypothetical protein [Burkholderia sp. Leaf177]|uniref:hypothetical protein n=1 Tax=Burkholderia sp. Leaf177 TaxID=1736287 RepID=UPI000B212492|nr:hypothetical protein [Burkholderia sp. Leaf177]